MPTHPRHRAADARSASTIRLAPHHPPIIILLGLALGLVLTACADESVPAGPRASDARMAAAARPAAGAAAGAPDGVIPGEYIVTFQDSVKDVPGLAKRTVAEAGGTMRFEYTAAVRGFAARLPDQAAAALAHNPQVASIEQDRTVHAAGGGMQSPVPNWGLDRIDQTSLPLSGTFAYPSTGAGVNIYIIDSGIRTSHQEFGGRAVGAFTAIYDGRGTDDCYFHGTAVASTAGGQTVGVAKGATLWAVRMFDCNGSGTASGLLAAVDWVTKNRRLPAVANMSLNTANSPALNSAVANSIAAGVTYVVAAGNRATDACQYSPGNLPASITVAGSTRADGQLGVSNFGSCVDLYAPGESIEQAFIINGDAAYGNGSGTSAATPHVAGVAALVLAANPSATPSEVAQLIKQRATPNVLSGIGPGSPNLLLSVSAAGPVGDVPPPPPPPPADTATPPPSDTNPTSPEPTPPADTTVTEPPPTADAPPTAAFTSKCQAARSKCGFDGRGSGDDKGIASFTWTFGDGSAPVTVTTPNLLYTYQSTGTYVVTLKVTDTAGQESTATRTVSVKRL